MDEQDSDLVRLQRYITGGRFMEQSQLPPERHLAEELGLTRSRLRTCLAKLERDGLIWRHVGKGTFVGAKPADDPQPRAVSTGPSDVMDARIVLEPELAHRAALRSTPDAIVAMRECVEQMDPGNYAVFEYWDQRLHREIAKAANSPLLLAMFDLTQVNRNLMEAMQRRGYTQPVRLAEGLREHVEIVDAIAARDAPGAADRMRHHLRSVKRTLFGE